MRRLESETSFARFPCLVRTAGPVRRYQTDAKFLSIRSPLRHCKPLPRSAMGPLGAGFFVQRMCAHGHESMTGQACGGRSGQIWESGDVAGGQGCQYGAIAATKVGFLHTLFARWRRNSNARVSRVFRKRVPSRRGTYVFFLHRPLDQCASRSSPAAIRRVRPLAGQKSGSMRPR